MTDEEELAHWAPRVLADLAKGPLVYCSPGLMGAVCDRLVEQGLVTREPAGMMKGLRCGDAGFPQYRYELARPAVHPLPTVAGGFKTLLADPPWSFKAYDKRELVPTLGQQPYQTMSLADLKALPVPDICAPDCVLILWTVSYLQDEATELARSWGFAPKSIAFVWDKQALGMGYWTRQEVEIAKLYTRGKPRRLSKGVRQLIRAPRRAHSQKPPEQYERIEQLVEGPYCELFARPVRKRRGWSYWGNQLDRFTQGGNEARLRQSQD